MKTPAGTLRTTVSLLIAMAMTVALAACGGGGGGTSSASPGTSGPATVSVSVASAPSYPAGTTFALSALSPSTAAPANSPDFAHVWVTVNRIALIPVDSIPSMERNKPHQDGELEEEDTADSNGGFVTVALDPPKMIDLRNPPSGAKILNRLQSVPAGEYGKIRVYYDNVVGEPAVGDKVLFHPTAHYHFDVHFVGGNLVVPVSSDPSEGIRFYQITIGVVGLKYHQAGNGGNVLLRPQVFAKVIGAPEYIVSGVADNVTPSNANLNGNFDILTPGGRSIPAAFSGTGTHWAYSDNVLNGSQMVYGRDNTIAVPALKNRAELSAIGVFDTGGRLQASHITFTFPDVRIGKTLSTWSTDNTYFRLDRPWPLDNLVYALPNKETPLYTDFKVLPVELANGYNLIVTTNHDNTVKARGYAVTGSQGLGLQAFWISIDNNIVIGP